MRHIKIIIERHPDGYVGYPLGLRGPVVGEGDTCYGAFADVKSAIKSHIETFGDDILHDEPAVLEAFVAETDVEL